MSSDESRLIREALIRSSEKLKALTDELHLDNCASKHRRLGLPVPGSMLRSRTGTMLSVIHANDFEGDVVYHNAKTLLLLIYVNTSPPPHPKGPVVDPVELVLMGKDGVLYSTRTRAAADVMTTYEVL